MRFRNLCFTDFTKTELNGDDYVECWKQSFPVVLLVVQKERCPESGRLHWQGYCRFSKQVSGSSLQLVFTGLHMEKRRGSEAQAIDYCCKEETRFDGPWQIGELAAPGKRGDLETVQDAIRQGANEFEIAEEHFATWCRYERAFSKYIGMLAQPRSNKTHSVIYWGVAGTGKTRTVYDTHGYDNVYDMPRPNGGSFWFDGLIPGKHQALLLDDFYGWLPLHLLLKLMDRYPLKVPRKGGMVEFSCTNLYITSNKHYDEWYNWQELGHNLKEAFERRIDEIKEFTRDDFDIPNLFQLN